MKRAATTLGAVLTIALITTACGGGGGGSKGGVTPPVGGNPYSGPTALSNFTYGAQGIAHAAYVAPLGPGDENIGISMQVGLKMQNAQGLIQYAQDASNPNSSVYRRFLTPQQIGQRYGATDADTASTFKYFAGYGISAGGWPQKLMVSVTGSVKQFEAAFGTPFAWYSMQGKRFLAPVGQPHTSVVVPISSVVHMAQFTNKQNYLIRASAGNFWGLSPQQIGRLFDYSGAWSAGYTGAGINTAIIGTGPIITGSQGDLAQYSALFNNASVASVQVVTALAQSATAQNNQTGTGQFDLNPGGLTTAPPTTTTGCNQTFPANYTVCNPEDGEAQLDQEQIAGLAPGSNVLFYLAYNPALCLSLSTGGLQTPDPTGSPCPAAQNLVAYPELGIQLTDDEIQQAIADNTADSLSMSFGEDESAAEAYGYFDATGVGVGPSEDAALTAEGIAVFVSSGDNGADACQDPSSGAFIAGNCVSFPASDPSFVAVGGLNTPVDNSGNLEGQMTVWGDETTNGGNGTFYNNIGGGGGVSKFFTTPIYQAGITSLPAGNPPLGGYRGVPDIALLADPATGPSLTFNAGGGWVAGASGGTSAAAPEANAMWALVLQACKASASCATAGGAHPYRLGNPNALFYKIASSSGLNGYSYGQVFYDVLFGNIDANAPRGPGSPTPGPLQTGCCYAGTGYDLASGLGAPMAGHLIDAIVKGASAP
ncbi:MAG TPA: protease pro-enzyme activation domain-containing protein [Verrucomicrobiae bacterium]|jgi:subtilase family serine protease|nr:protease pro-enzyme activation domain-containing protein [Verrucomicrobiae bacterium]